MGSERAPFLFMNILHWKGLQMLQTVSSHDKTTHHGAPGGQAIESHLIVPKYLIHSETRFLHSKTTGVWWALNSLVVKSVYVWTKLKAIGPAEERTSRAPLGSMFNARLGRYIVFELFFAFALGSRANASVAIPAYTFIVRLLVLRL